MPENSLPPNRPFSTHFPPLGQEPFNLVPDDLTDAEAYPQLPTAEKEIRTYFEALAEPTFTLYPEVFMRTPGGDRIRIDYVGREKTGTVKGLVGFEMKSGTVGSAGFTDFSAAIAQSIDYSKARITSDLVDQSDWFGTTLKYVFQFPCPYRIYEFENSKTVMRRADMWAQGALKVAGKFGVGAIGYVPSHRDWGCILAGHAAFWMKTGPTDLALRHAKRNQAGSGR